MSLRNLAARSRCLWSSQVDARSSKFSPLVTKTPHLLGYVERDLARLAPVTLCKQDIPLLEFDPTPDGIISANEGVTFPETAVMAFLHDVTDAYAVANDLPVLHKIPTVSWDVSVYSTELANAAGVSREIALVPTLLGAPAAVALAEILIANGVKKIVAVGSCGALHPLPENVFLVPTRALRDEGTSYHYLPASRWVDTTPELLGAMEAVLQREGIGYRECKTWTTIARRNDGCDVVDMECAALAACANFRGVQFGQLLYTADTIADPEAYEERGFGKDSREIGLQLALKVASELG